jgi:hypothetical protein
VTSPKRKKTAPVRQHRDVSNKGSNSWRSYYPSILTHFFKKWKAIFTATIQKIQRKSGTVRQRPNGKWEARFRYVDVYGETSEAMRQRSRSIIDQVMEEARTPKKAAGKG